MLLECMIITEDQNLKYTITSSLLKPLCSSTKLGWCRVMGGGAAHQMAHMAKVLRVILYTSPALWLLWREGQDCVASAFPSTLSGQPLQAEWWSVGLT